MSGPIIRKYGFPNFDRIFGPKDVPHGADPAGPDPAPPAEPDPGPKPTGASAEPIRSDDPEPPPPSR